MSSRSSGSTTSTGASRNASFERQAAETYTRSITTSSGESREARYQRQAQQIRVDNLNKEVEQAKLAYMRAQQLGDIDGMKSAHKQEEDLRAGGATLGEKQDSALTKQIKMYYDNSGIKVAIETRSVDQLNKGIVQAKNDNAYAQATHDQTGMAAASQLASNLRALGGSIGTNVTLADAKYTVQKNNSSYSEAIKGLVHSAT